MQRVCWPPSQIIGGPWPDYIENSRIELKGIVLQVPLNQIKVTFIIIFALQLGAFVIFPVSHRN